MNYYYRISVSAILTVIFSLVQLSPATAGDNFSPYVDTKGNINFPHGFRTSMVHLGSWFVPKGEASGFHDVYTEKETVQTYQKTGKFPDGATIVKELRTSKPGSYTTGQNVSHATGSIKQWFVMIKDTKGRFSGNPLWGDGWGWALYKPADKNKNISTDYKTDCRGCHVPAKDTDWVYVEAYPTLLRE